MQKLKQKILIALLALILINPSVAVAQPASTTTVTNAPTTYQGVQESLSEFLCTPSESADGRDFERCINKLYRFGISFGAIALVFFVVFAGYMYMAGGETGKGKAKAILQNALVGMGILLFSFVLLRFINPNLVTFKPIQPPIFTAADIPTCEAVGFGEKCVVMVDGQAVTSGDNAIFGADYDKAQSASLANTLLNNSKVVTTCYDNTSHGPKKNLQDAAAQQPSQTNTRGKTYLHQAMLNGLVKVAVIVNSYCISEIAGGEHSDNSRHYVGLGFDIAQINGSTANASNPASARVMEECRKAGATEVLGPIKPDSGHATHVHCGWPRVR